MKRQAYAYAVAVVLLWSTVASAFKISLRYLSFLQLLLFSSITATLVFLALLTITGEVRKVKESFAKHVLSSALLGFLNPFLYYMLLFKAYSILPAQEAQALNYTWPILLVLLSATLLGQRITLRDISALVLGFLGVLVVSTRGDLTALRFKNLPGVLIALSSAFVWALYWVLNLRDKRKPIVKLFSNFAFGTSYSLAAAILTSQITPLNPLGLVGAVYVGLFEMGITFALWLKALSLAVNTAQVSNLVYLIPFLSLVVIHFAVGEEIMPSSVLGLTLIVAGVTLREYTLQRTSAVNNSSAQG